MFKNMKILVENNLDEIVAELEKRGYRQVCDIYEWDNLIGCDAFGSFFATNPIYPFLVLTLAELKEM